MTKNTFLDEKSMCWICKSGSLWSRIECSSAGIFLILVSAINLSLVQTMGRLSVKVSGSKTHFDNSSRRRRFTVSANHIRGLEKSLSVVLTLSMLFERLDEPRSLSLEI